MKNKRIGAAVLAALVAAVTALGLVHDAPRVDYNPAVTSPATRGFGEPCQTEDFVSVGIFGFTRPWNEGSLLPLQAAIDFAEATSDYRPRTSVGTYNCRVVRGTTSTWSHHAWAVAVDFDPGDNCLGCAVETTELGHEPEFVRAFEKFGFVWGGRWTSRPDAMHFEVDAPALPVLGTLQPGDRGALVTRLRGYLADLKLPHMSSGPYGEKDLLGVIAFQKRNGLLVSETPGTVGAETWVLLVFALL